MISGRGHAPHRFALAVAALALAALSWPARAGLGATAADGTIRGIIDIRQSHVMTEARPAAAAMGATPNRPPELRPAVVYLDVAPRGAFEPDEAARATMDQRDQSFVPHVLAITVGTTVDFPNSDPYFHNVFSLSKTRSFDLGSYARGRSKSVRFDRPGVVQVFCDIHSHMSAYILVFAHRYFAVTDAAGRYEIARVPPGTYTLNVWHEGDVRETRSIVVARGRRPRRGRLHHPVGKGPTRAAAVAHQSDLPRRRPAGRAGHRLHGGVRQRPRHGTGRSRNPARPGRSRAPSSPGRARRWSKRSPCWRA